MSLSTILIIVLIIVLISSLPTWPHAQSWGYTPGGIVGVILVVILVLVLLGKI